MSRPQSISSEDIVAAGYVLLFERGLAGLTFESLASRVGLVPAALVKRFGSKKQLLAEIDRYAMRQTDAKVAQAIRDSRSPVDAIITQFVTEMSFATSPESLANGLEFLALDLRDETLYHNYKGSFEHRHQQIVDLLKSAQQQGQLTGVTDFDELATHLELVLHGVGHVWVMTQTSTLPELLEHHVRLALTPYTAK